MSAAPPGAVELRAATFLTSAASLRQCPPDTGSEVAFAGRSNAGKSSAINRITGRRSLARTSRTPGRTQLLNFFDLGDDRRLVDLPGYGYARVPTAVKNAWTRELEAYLSRRRSLRGLILLMDIRHPLKPQDQQLLAWSGAALMPAHVLLTKADKLSRGAAMATLNAVRGRLAADAERISVQLFSATRGDGLAELEDTLGAWLHTGGGA